MVRRAQVHVDAPPLHGAAGRVGPPSVHRGRGRGRVGERDAPVHGRGGGRRVSPGASPASEGLLSSGPLAGGGRAAPLLPGRSRPGGAALLRLRRPLLVLPPALTKGVSRARATLTFCPCDLV